MPKFILNNFLKSIDIVSFFSKYFERYTFDKNSNSFIISGSKDIFEIDRFIFYTENDIQHYYYFKDQTKGNLLDLVVNSNISYFDKHSKIKVGILILKKYLQTQINFFHYNYFQDITDAFLSQYLSTHFTITFDDSKYFYSSDWLLPVFTDINQSVIKTYRFVDPKKNIALKPHFGFHYTLYKKNDQGVIYLYYSQIDYVKDIRANSYNKICFLENDSVLNIKHIIGIIKKYQYNKVLLYNSDDIKNKFFIFNFLLEYSNSYYNLTINQHQASVYQFNHKSLTLLLLFKDKNDFISGINSLVTSLKRYNKKIAYDYNSIYNIEDSEKHVLDVFKVVKHSYYEYKLIIPYEKEALNIINSYLIKTIFSNNIEQTEVGPSQ